MKPNEKHINFINNCKLVCIVVVVCPTKSNILTRSSAVRDSRYVRIFAVWNDTTYSDIRKNKISKAERKHTIFRNVNPISYLLPSHHIEISNSYCHTVSVEAWLETLLLRCVIRHIIFYVQIDETYLNEWRMQTFLSRGLVRGLIVLRNFKKFRFLPYI